MRDKGRNFKAKGIILGSKTLGETDKLVFIYTREHGKIKAIAKGATKQLSRFTGALETLNSCEFELYKSPRKIIITEVKVEKNFRKIRENLQKITSGLLIARLTDELLPEEEPIPKVFDLMEKILRETSMNETFSSLASATFLIKLLDILGLLPDFKESENFHTKLPLKYKKLFNYIKERSTEEIKKIIITKKESGEIKALLKEIIESETEKALNLPL